MLENCGKARKIKNLKKNHLNRSIILRPSNMNHIYRNVKFFLLFFVFSKTGCELDSIKTGGFCAAILSSACTMKSRFTLVGMLDGL